MLMLVACCCWWCSFAGQVEVGMFQEDNQFRAVTVKAGEAVLIPQGEGRGTPSSMHLVTAQHWARLLLPDHSCTCN
jgi:hypothetical protein